MKHLSSNRALSMEPEESAAPRPAATLEPGHYLTVTGSRREVIYDPDRLDRTNTSNALMCLILLVVTWRLMFAPREKCNSIDSY